MKKIIYIVLFTSFIFACEKVDCPNTGGCVEPEKSCINSLGIDTCLLFGTLQIKESEPTTFRKILIKEFTGYKCFNCPEGAEEIERIKSLVGDTLVAVAVHSGIYAKPDNEKYITDFRTETGNEYESMFIPIGYPTAVVNMKKFDDNYQQGRTKWAESIRSEINNSPQNVPSIKLKSYISNDAQKFFAQATISFSEANSTNHNLIFLFVEDHIIDVQLNGNEYQTNYDHRHVLRSAITKHLGERVNTEPINQGDSILISSDYLDLQPEWDLDNCYLVGILYNADNLEVVQVHEMSIF